MLTLRMAFRNIFRQRRRTVLTALSMIGGVSLAVIFIGWSDGSYNDIIDKFTRNRLGHIQIHQRNYLDRPSLYKTIDDPHRVGEALEEIKNVEYWAPRVYSAGLVAVRDKSAAVQIIGIDPEKEKRMTHFDQKIIRGKTFSSKAAHEAILGKGLADILHARIGDEIVIISQGADGSIAEDLYHIIGISSSGDDIGDRAAFYLHLKDAQQLLVLGNRVHEIAVTVKKLGQVKKATDLISGKLNNPQLSVAPWQVFARSFYNAMQADKEGMWIMLVIIVIIVAVGVLNTVLMSVLERRREYGLLKAIGSRPRQIIKVVLLEVLILGLMCIIIGSGIGLAANSYLSGHGIKISSLYKGIESFTYGGIKFEIMKSEINSRSFIIPAVTVIIVALVVSFFPALKAARTEPASTMRMH
ncbi:MAG: ABC transporter permease [Candidatus Aminicenantales bacterium]